MKKILMLFFILWSSLMNIVSAGHTLEAVYPYSLDSRAAGTVFTGGTVPLFYNIVCHDEPEQSVQVEVELPVGFSVAAGQGWVQKIADGRVTASKGMTVDANYGKAFGILYVKAPEHGSGGNYTFTLKASGAKWQDVKRIDFRLLKAPTEEKKERKNAEEKTGRKTKKKLNSEFNWYIQNVVFPVDANGEKDLRSEKGVLYVRDTSLEGFRNRMTGGGATNWSAVFNHPAAFLALDMRNPQMDVRLLKFKAQLIDKVTGEPVPGLCTAGTVNDDGERGWENDKHSGYESTAMISLNGKKSQEFILPVYVDYFTVVEGDYSLRVTVSGNNGQEKVQEIPVKVAKKQSFGILSVGFAGICALLVLLCCRNIREAVNTIGAKGAISVALFAAMAFGGITLPTTVFGDFLHVFLGPFSGLVTGILSGVLQYLLIVSLLILFRAPGVLSLMFLIKFLLSGLMFGHFSPVGILSCCVSIVVLEAALYFCGFYSANEIDDRYMIFVSVLLGVADAGITFVNLQQMMFFYRLYYADWYLALYMIINGMLYSSIGAWLGYKTGRKLKQVMGE